MADWDPPFPVDLVAHPAARTRLLGRHRAAPKAFVALADGQRLWSSRFGDVTSVRLAPPAGADRGGLARDAASGDRRGAIGPGGRRPVACARCAQRRSRRARARPTSPALFLAFSFFLLAAAVLLVALLEGLAVERRAREVGLLGALGFPARAVRRRLLAEAGCVSALGALVGLAGAVGYAGR